MVTHIKPQKTERPIFPFTAIIGGAKISSKIEVIKSLLEKSYLEMMHTLDIDLEIREQDIFPSTMFGDDKDRAVSKEDGSHTYFASDIAYHQNKIKRGFKKIINLMGADHHGYVPRMEAVLQAMGYDKKIFKILLVQFVSLLRGGEKVSPLEIDEALLKHPEIDQAVTFAIPHEKLGEEIAAAIILSQSAKTGTREIKEVLAKYLSSFKIPKKIV